MAAMKMAMRAKVRVMAGRLCEIIHESYILRLKSRRGGRIKQFIYDTVLTYSMYAALRFSTNRSIQRTMTTFELEYILQLKSRHGGWLEQFVCDTVLTYKEVRCLRFPAHHSIQCTMTTFELEYSDYNVLKYLRDYIDT
jgi:hypothetical protein